MSKHVSTRIIPLVLALAAAALLAVSVKLPLWHLRMEAPQYRGEEALKVLVYPGALRGDLNEIKTLNQYIGVHIPSQLSQLRWLPATLWTAAALGLAVSLLPVGGRRWGLVLVPALLSVALLAAAVQAQAQMYDIGHKRDHKTKLVGVKDFTPPLLGRSRIAQFDLTSGFGAGAWLIGLAIVLQLAGSRAGGRRKYVEAAKAGGQQRAPEAETPAWSKSKSKSKITSTPSAPLWTTHAAAGDVSPTPERSR